MAESLSYRLPRSVVPHHYHLEFWPDLSQDRFSGKSDVTIDVVERVQEFVLNGAGIEVDSATLELAQGRVLSAEVTYHAAEEQVVLTWPEFVESGTYHLLMNFTGALAEDLRGFYRTTVTAADGSRLVIASTQCESTDARRVFPGWDEPDFKATFSITLTVDAGLTALSNGQEISNVDDGTGKRRVSFAKTIPMSTYLVALVVGPFVLTEPVMVDKVAVRIAARADLAHLTDLAQESAEATLRFFQEYFGIAYPGEKIDHVAIPEFAAGAMENLGCVTYRENALLIDRQRSSPMEQMRVVTVIAHETAHMWFGDLVTMRWWNGLWLNEAFATFMELLAADALHPEWDVWTTFGPGRAYALSVDGLASTRPIEFPVGPPSEAAAMFDVLTYEKGGAVLRALEQYLGPEVFRRGIGRYLKKHRYGNTETADLWDALEEESGQPVRTVMDSWVVQRGYPMVRVAWDKQAKILRVHQEPFRYLGSAEGIWRIPLVIGIGRPSGQSESRRVLLDENPLEMSLPEDTEYVLVNQGGWGFYRVAYDRALWDRLLAGRSQFSALERLGLVDDAFAAVLADQLPLDQAVRLWRTFPGETDPDVWSALYRQLTVLNQIGDEDDRAAVRAFSVKIAAPLLNELGFDAKAGENVRKRRLRALVVRLLGVIGEDPSVREQAHQRLRGHFAKSEAISPDLLPAIVEVVAASADAKDWENFYHQFKAASNPQDETRYLYALAEFRQPELIQRTLDLYQSPEVKIQDGILAISRALSNRYARQLTWDLVEASWQKFLDKYPHQMMQYLVQPIGLITEDGLAERTVQWIDDHPIEEVGRQMAQAKEFQTIHRQLAKRLKGRIAEILDA